jgi:hypothetical protein
MDVKADDGDPCLGKFVAFNGNADTYSCIKQSDGTTNASRVTYTGSGIYNFSCGNKPGIFYMALPFK